MNAPQDIDPRSRQSSVPPVSPSFTFHATLNQKKKSGGSVRGTAKSPDFFTNSGIHGHKGAR